VSAVVLVVSADATKHNRISRYNPASKMTLYNVIVTFITSLTAWFIVCLLWV